jgi:hypothetical protein
MSKPLIDITEFASILENKIKNSTPSSAFKNEAEFEAEHVINPAWELSKIHPEIIICVHPSNSKETCHGSCEKAILNPTLRILGCPTCWKTSKNWSMVKAYGLQHNFDLVARDMNGKSLAVEVKWLSFSGRRGPNSEFQRFIGQCTLAAACHDVVLGVCGIKGTREKNLDKHTLAVSQILQKIGVRIVILSAI